MRNDITYIVKFTPDIYEKVRAIFGERLIMYLQPSFEYIDKLQYGPDPRISRFKAEVSPNREAVLMPEKEEFVILIQTSTGYLRIVETKEASDRIRIALPYYAIDIFEKLEVTEIRSDVTFTQYYNEENLV